MNASYTSSSYMTHDPSRRALSFDSRLDGRRDSTHCHTSRLDGGLDGRQDGCQKISPVVTAVKTARHDGSLTAVTTGRVSGA